MIDNNKKNEESGSKKQRQDTGNENIEGRLQGSQNPEFEKEDSQHDISNVDMQEGNMNNGMLGGNFDVSEQNETGAHRENG